MALTAKEMTMLKKLIKETCETAVDKSMNGCTETMDEIKDIAIETKEDMREMKQEIKEMKKVMLGDKEFNVKGKKEEHDEMYEKFPDIERAVKNFWPIHKDYRGFTWFMKYAKWIIVGLITAFIIIIGWLLRLTSSHI